MPIYSFAEDPIEQASRCQQADVAPVERRQGPAGGAALGSEQNPTCLSIRRGCGKKVLDRIQWNASVHEVGVPGGRNVELFVWFIWKERQ